MNIQEALLSYKFMTTEVRGRNEFEVYKNYINDMKLENILFLISKCEEALEGKSDLKAAQIRKEGNEGYTYNDLQESRELYTKSLQYATYNGKEYALALANRSAVYFALKDYQSCIKDINLCLNASYPDDLKPKVLIRKAECYKLLGDAVRMRGVLMDILNFIDDSKAFSSDRAEKYKCRVQNLILAKASKKTPEEKRFDVLPDMDKNPTFLNAASSIALQYNKRKGYHVVAKKDIARGDVLFVEKAFAWTHSVQEDNDFSKEICSKCMAKVTSSVPCKKCVKRLYCSEKCRDSAWNEFHQWECPCLNLDLVCDNLAFQTALKGMQTECSTTTKNPEELVANYGSENNNYPFVYNLPFPPKRMYQKSTVASAQIAAISVNYLKLKTNFFAFAKKLPANANKSELELMDKMGGLIIRHGYHNNRSALQVIVPKFDSSKLNALKVGEAICPSVAMMNYACVPNTLYYFVGDVVVVKALEDIKANKEIYANHTGVCMINMPKEFRLYAIKELYLSCQCQLCRNPRLSVEALNAYLCVKCNGPATNLHDDDLFMRRQLTCLDCNHKFMLTMESALKENVAQELLVQFKLFRDISDADACLKIMQSIYRPTHIQFIDLYKIILSYYENEDRLNCFLEIAKLAEDLCRQRTGGFYMKNGLIDFEFANTVVKMLTKFNGPMLNSPDIKNALEDATSFLNKAKVIFDLHYPPFLSHVQELEGKISKLQMAQASPTANKKKQKGKQF